MSIYTRKSSWYNGGMKKILTVPNPILRQTSKTIQSIDRKTQRLIKDLGDTLQSRSPRGVGLSAVQIGKTLRVFAILLPPSGDPEDKEKPILQIIINPEIIEASPELTLGPNKEKPTLEGCLSIPGFWGPVYRHRWVTVKYSTLIPKPYALRKRSETLIDFPSRVFQHELDHLNGILFTDRSVKDNLPIYEAKGEKLEEVSLAYAPLF